jgi:8-oxo-dGTP pyrophosphatase MutT (NUDIX family)
MIERHFVATAILIEKRQPDTLHVLLVYHPKMGKWLPPGGHVEKDELPHEAACRECFEETGLEVEAISSEGLFKGHIERWNAVSLPQPYAMLLENIPSWNQTPAHQHIDHIYQVQRKKHPKQQADSSLHTFRWFSWQELQSLRPNEEFFIETLQLLEPLLNTKSSDE